MGCEYKVRVGCEDKAQLDGFLRSLSCFAEFDQQWNIYRYREERNSGQMPSAEIKIEQDGLYLCDYGLSTEMFGLIVLKLISRFGKVHIEDYE